MHKHGSTPIVRSCNSGCTDAATGKAIEIAPDEKPGSFKTTFSETSPVRAMRKVVEREELDDLFNNTNLDRIASAVMRMFG